MNINHYFTSPIAFARNEELLPDLKKYIYKQKIQGIESDCAAQLKKNLVESKFDLFNKEDDIIFKTKDFIGESLANLISELHAETCPYDITFIDSWYHIGKRNSVHELHSHPNCSWCGVYYIQSGDEGSGETTFTNPVSSNYLDDGNRWFDWQLETKIPPQDGLLVLFPSYLRHYQSLYIGRKDRIVVAFNAQIWRGLINKPKYGIQKTAAGVAHT
tara:strand:- start:64 stop:711 length:648 start_codon:yes stop_codon:yes gene_type:complete